MEVSENQSNPRNVKLPKLITINYLNHKISFGHLINHTSFHKIWKVKSFAQLFWESSGNGYILHFERFAFLHFELFAGSFLAFCLDCIRVLAAANGFEKPREVLITSRFSWFRLYQQIFIILCDFCLQLFIFIVRTSKLFAHCSIVFILFKLLWEHLWMKMTDCPSRHHLRLPAIGKLKKSS